MEQNFSKSYSWKLFFYLTRIQFFKIIKHPGFIVLTIICLSFLNSNFIGNVVSSEIYPTTGFFLNQVAISEFPIILITLFFVGELVWRERHVNASAILDAYPVKNWVLFSSKITTVFLIQLLYAVIIVLFGILIQIFYFDYHQIELDLYLKVIFALHLIYYWIITVGFFFVQLLSPNKYIGFLFSALAIILILLLPVVGLESKLFQFAVMPDYKYSHINGLGPFIKPLFWHTIYWFLLAATLFMICFKIWPRGSGNVKYRGVFNLVKYSSFSYKAMILLFIMAFIACGIFISENKSEIRTSEQNFANYEKRFQKFESSPMPSIRRIQLKADLFPEKRKAVIKGTYLLVNRNKIAIDTLLISFLPATKLSLNGKNNLIEYAPEALGTRLYKLKNPMATGDTLILGFSYKIVAEDFNAQNPNINLIENGILLTNVGEQKYRYFPKIGYDRYSELQDSTQRKKMGLAREALGWVSLSDKEARKNAQRDFIEYEAIVSTSASQTGITNGSLQKTWQVDGRNYFKYKLDTLITNEIAVISGKYKHFSEKVNGTVLNIFYHPGHSNNLGEMVEGLATTLKIGKENRLKYLHSSLSIVEIPNYHRNFGNAYAMPTLILWSEDGGFLSNQKVKKAEYSKVFSTAAHEASHQWWPHVAQPAKAVEGGLMLNETLAQYARLRGLEKKYGRQTLNRFLLRERATYFYERRAVAREEPLIKTSQNFVAYNKGSLVMHSISELIGADSLDRAIRNYYKEFAFSDSVYPVSRDLQRHILEFTPDSLSSKIADMFEKVYVYDLGIESALATKKSDSQFQIDLQAFANKFEAGQNGLETEKEFTGFLPVKVYGKSDKVLYEENIQLEKGKLNTQILLEYKPVRIELDANMLYLDKDLENNVREIN